MILVVDHHTEFSLRGFLGPWQDLKPGAILSVTYFVDGPTWVADKISLLSRLSADLSRLPNPSGATAASADEPGGVRAKRTRRLTGTTGPTGTVRGIVTAVDQTCQSFVVHSLSSGDQVDLVVAVDNETRFHHGSDRAHWPQVNRGIGVVVQYFKDGSILIAQEITIGEPRSR
jgi:hypothetical protein